MLPLKPFYLIRHGETVANAASITAGGQFDTPLNQTGIKQAKMLRSVIGQLEVKPQIIYHSDMQRARDTATYINQTFALEMYERNDLREIDLGEWDGKPWDETLPRLENKETPPNGESEIQFATRIQNAITDVIKKSHERSPPMIVAHGGLFHALGYMYEYGISSVQNCHLHYFEPHPENALFPWKVCQFDIEGDALKRSSAVFCEPLLQQAS